WAGDLTTGTQGNGALTVTTNIVENSVGITDGNSAAATIGGNGKLIQIGGLDNTQNSNTLPAAGATVPQSSIYIADTYIPSKKDDLIITATIADQPVICGVISGLR